MDHPSLAYSRLADTLRQMLEGQLSYIEGSRRVVAWAHEAGFDRLDEPWVTFVAIESETDAIPTGHVRELWSEEAVTKQIGGWERAEGWAKMHGEAACREALTLLGYPQG